ncbi:MAG: hypothetical protein ACEPO2_19345 [Pelagibaca sp.]
MPVLQPTMPGMAFKPLHRVDLTTKPADLANPYIAAGLPNANRDDGIVPPAAPPSAVQMQIKALISEQALGIEAAREAQTDS